MKVLEKLGFFLIANHKTKIQLFSYVYYQIYKSFVAVKYTDSWNKLQLIYNPSNNNKYLRSKKGSIRTK